jgi:hydroxymethylbilane synthase
VHWANLPLNAKVGTSSVLRQQQILQLRPDITIVNIRGSIGERLELVKQGQLDGVVMAVCALKRLKLEGEIKDIFPWDGQPLQGQLAVVGRRGDQELKKLFSVLNKDKVKGDSPQNGDRAKVFLHCGTHPEIYSHLGQIIPWPMITIKAVLFDEVSRKDLLQAFCLSDIIIFTSRYAVEHFLRTLLSVDPSVELGRKSFAVIGRYTKEALEEFNVKPAIVAHEETAQGLCQAISGHMNVQHKRILFPRSSLPNPFLKESLSALGAIVTEITVYENTKPAKRPLPSLNVKGIIFTSPSTVRNFLADYVTIPAPWLIFAKGPVTLKVLQQEGYDYATPLS